MSEMSVGLNRRASMNSVKTPQEKDDFAALNLDRPRKSDLKTQEQVRKHCVDTYLETRVIDRALYILSNGEEIQRISVVKNIPNLIVEDFTGCIQRVIPRMQQTLPSGSTEYNMAACSTIQAIAQENNISPQNFTKAFLELILNSIESQDTVAADSWLATLLDVIDILPSSILQTEIFPVFANKAHISKPVRVRIISCRVLGRLAALLAPAIATKDVLPIIVSLCQDPSGNVRASMCKELPHIATLLSQDSNKYLLNSIIDLANDEDINVREAALQSIAHLIPFVPIPAIKSTIIPLTKKLFGTSIEKEDHLIVSVALMYGEYCIRLKDFLPLVDKVWLLSRYIYLSQVNITSKRKGDHIRLAISSEEEELNRRLTQCRTNCAYNFPAMVAFTSDLKPDQSEKLPGVLQNFTSDSYFMVRKTVACGFHELFKLQPRWIPILRIEFMKLLKDENEAVLEGIIPHIGTILTTLAESQGIDKTDTAQPLMACELLLFESLNWRLHAEMLNQLQVIPKCFPPDFVNQHFVPLLMQRTIYSRTLPCKMGAIKIILLIMADEAQAKQKQKMRSQLLELCTSFNFYSRMTFVRAVTLLLDISPKVLKELFYHNIITMTEDNVPNIRLAVCKIIPKLKLIAFEPYDRRLIAALESSIRKLSNEVDKDVLEQIKIMHLELEEVDRCKKMYKAARESDASSPSRFDRTFTQAGNYMQNQPSKIKFSSGGQDKSSITPGNQGKNSIASNKREPSPVPTSPKTNIKSSFSKRFDDSLTFDEFLVDAGISLSTANCSTKTIQVKPSKNFTNPLTNITKVPENSSVNQEKPETNSKTPTNDKSQLKPIRRLPTPRPAHRFTGLAGTLTNNTDNNEMGKADANFNLADKQDKPNGTMIMENKNSSILRVINKKLNERPSGLPLKVNQTKLSIEDAISESRNDTELFSQQILKNKHRERFKLQPNRTTDVKKRLSLDVDTISNRTIKTPNKYNNVNKRYSLSVDVKKDLAKNSLTYINNNTVGSSTLPSPSTTSTAITKHQPRPQSCLLKNTETESFSNTKRSMSVENLPPKSIRPASRLPVRAVDPKSSKQK